LNNTKPLSPAEIEELREVKRARYFKELEALCSSEEIRQQARRISSRMDSCGTCVFSSPDFPSCRYPHSDAYIEDLDIDHCYEGVLRYLVRDANMCEAVQTAAESTAALLTAPTCLQNEVFRDNRVILVLCGIILDMADSLEMPPRAVLEGVREVFKSTAELLSGYEQLSQTGDTP